MLVLEYCRPRFDGAGGKINDEVLVTASASGVLGIEPEAAHVMQLAAEQLAEQGAEHG
jgi:hypothetical protein